MYVTILNPAVVFAETLEVMLPLEFDDAEPPANQFHDANVVVLLLLPASEPTVNPSLSNEVTPDKVCSASVASDVKSCVAPLATSNS